MLLYRLFEEDNFPNLVRNRKSSNLWGFLLLFSRTWLLILFCDKYNTIHNLDNQSSLFTLFIHFITWITKLVWVDIKKLPLQKRDGIHEQIVVKIRADMLQHFHIHLFQVYSPWNLPRQIGQMTFWNIKGQ